MFGVANSITLSNSYFNTCNYLVTKSAKTIIKNCTFDNIQFYENDFSDVDTNYLFISNSKFDGPLFVFFILILLLI